MKSLRRPAALLCLAASLVFSESHAACVEKPHKPMTIQDDVAIDPASHLIWRRCPVGSHWAAARKRCDGAVQGLTQKEAAVAARRAGAGWRVPSASELASLRRHRCNGLMIDADAFPNLAAANFGEGASVWSSSTAISPDTFYFVNFTDGSIDFHSDGFNLAVLLVKSR